MLNITMIVMTIILTRLIKIPRWLTANAGNQGRLNMAVFYGAKRTTVNATPA
jgi:hypothetical protein